MALTYPLPLAEFFGTLARVEITLDLDPSVEVDETAGGEIVDANYGPMLWEGTATCATKTHADQRRAIAHARLLQEAGASFFVTPSETVGPRMDPNGVIMGAATPTILAINANRRDATITGLPANYALTEGDYVSYTYGSPTRYGFAQIQNSRTANASGVTGTVQFHPPLRAAVAAGAPLVFVRPFLKAKMMRSAFQSGRSLSVVQTGFSFAWRQTLS